VFDPRGTILPGTVIENTTAMKIASRGVVTLPVDQSKMFRGAFGSFAHRFYGTGLLYAGMRATRACALRVSVDALVESRIYWVARIVPSNPAKPVSGSFKFAADTSQPGISSGLSNLESNASEIVSRQVDEHGGVTLVGLSSIQPSVEGELGTVLHGIAENSLVVMHAASVLRGAK
jgi:hypothetical protein